MTNIYSAHRVMTTALIALAFMSALFALSAPSFTPSASAEPLAPTESDLISVDDLLPSAFSDNVGLGNADVRVTIANIIKAALSFLGIVAVCFVLYGGVKWMTAGGNTENAKEAQKIMISALIGLAIILSAWAITSFVVTQLIGATQAE